MDDISGADEKCMSDSNYPETGLYKAMISRSTRIAAVGSQTDWVLQASKECRRLARWCNYYWNDNI